MLESLDIRSVEPYGDRPYEWVVATARYAVPPDDSGTVDLAAAPRDADGLVRFSGDVRLLRPVGGGNGRALVVVPNRGLTMGVPFSLDVAMAWDPAAAPGAGDGFLLDEGWTIAWPGWQWDVDRSAGFLGLDAPVADVPPSRMRVEFRPDAVLADHSLSDEMLLFRFAPLPVHGGDDPAAELTVRTTPMGPRAVVPRSAWRFTAGGTRVELDGGFQPFHWYELAYTCGFAPVVGAGLLAVRDLASSLRADHAHVFGWGVSQSGRLLRELLASGRNPFDGVFAHIAGARRGEFDLRHGQPALTHPLTPGYGPPHDWTSILRERGPKVMLTNSAWEYWRGDGALVHQDPVTGDDLPEDPDVRAHLLSGTDHYGPIPLKANLPVANPVHELDAGPVLRALFVQLVEWVCDGVEPTPSQVPRRSDATLVERPTVLERFGAAVEGLPWTPAIDPSSTEWPLPLGEPLVALVSDVDAGGNEVAGIRLPEVEAGPAAFTGWNPRRPVDGLPSVLYEFCGSRLPLLADVPRVSLRAAAESLAARRLLLARDVDRFPA